MLSILVYSLIMLILSCFADDSSLTKIANGKPKLLTTKAGNVLSITQDLFNESDLLMGNATCFMRFNVKTRELTIIAGSAAETGYREGKGTEALFSGIHGIIQLRNRTTIVSDHNNHCLRRIDESNTTSPYIGRGFNLTCPGPYSSMLFGPPPEFLFFHPKNLIQDNLMIYFVDQLKGGRVGVINPILKSVRTLVTLRDPIGLTVADGLPEGRAVFTISQRWIYGVTIEGDIPQLFPVNLLDLNPFYPLYSPFSPQGIYAVDSIGMLVADGNAQHIVYLDFASLSWYELATAKLPYCYSLYFTRNKIYMYVDTYGVWEDTHKTDKGLYQIDFWLDDERRLEGWDWLLLMVIASILCILLAFVFFGIKYFISTKAKIESANENITNGEDRILPGMNIDENGQKTPENASPNMADTATQRSHDKIGVRSVEDDKIKELFFTDEVYLMTSPVRGRTLILHIDEYDQAVYKDQATLDDREGSEIDRDRLRQLMTELGFIVSVAENPNSQAIKDALEAETKKTEHENYGMFTLIILAHGNNRVIYGSDARPVSYHDIYKRLSAECFPGMKGKPKWIIIQACAGNDRDVVTDQCKIVLADGHQSDTRDTKLALVVGSPLGVRQRKRKNQKQKKDKRIAAGGLLAADGPVTLRTNVSDMIILQSSFPGYVSLRNEVEGSYMVEGIVEVLQNHACHNHLYELVLKIRRYVVEKSKSDHRNTEGSQTPYYSDTLLKKLHLFPHYNPDPRPDTDALPSDNLTG